MTFGELMDELRAAADDFESMQIDEEYIGGDDDIDPNKMLSKYIAMLRERVGDAE